MKLITERDLIMGVAEAWSRQYAKASGDKAVIKKMLQALDKETATGEDVKDIIGNYSWTRIMCNECGQYSTLVVQVGQEPDYESNTADLCAECLTKAFNLLQKETK